MDERQRSGYGRSTQTSPYYPRPRRPEDPQTTGPEQDWEHEPASPPRRVRAPRQRPGGPAGPPPPRRSGGNRKSRKQSPSRQAWRRLRSNPLALVLVAVLLMAGLSTVIFVGLGGGAGRTPAGQDLPGGIGHVGASGDPEASDGPSPSGTPGRPLPNGPRPFAPSGLNGAGFMNVVKFSPFKDSNGRRPVLIGADIAGIHRSVDGGKNWTISNVGLGGHHIASLMFSDSVPGKVYAATDDAMYVSTNFGQSWSSKPAPVGFDGNGKYFVKGSSEHPRPTGNLFAQDNSGPTKYLYAATATGGVKRSSNDGETWEQVALVGDHLRSIALSPTNPDVLYVADAYKGLQVSTNARGAMTFTRAGGGPDIPEELLFVNNKLYVAANTSGIFVYDGSWRALNNGISLSSAWESIAASPDGGTLYVGCANPSGSRHTMRSTDGGASWSPISTGPGVSVSPMEYGQSINWWASNNKYLSFSGVNFVTSDIAVNPDNPAELIIAGRGGAKVGVRNGSGWTWYPAVHDLLATVNMMAAPDPKLPGRVYIGSMDYTILGSTDNANSVVNTLIKPAKAPSTGDYITFDPDGPPGKPSTVYLAASERGQNTRNGYLYSNPDPIGSPGAWTDEQIPVKNDVLSVGVGHSASGSRIILASITNSGLFRKDGSSWSKVNGAAPFASGGYGSFAWQPGSQLVYALDNGGVWRSDKAGAEGSWVKLSGASAEYGNINSLAIDPSNPDIVYASSKAFRGVVRISGTSKTTILQLSSPGPLGITPTGVLYVHDRNGARLLRSTNPSAANPAFTNTANRFYAQNNPNIRSLAVGPDGFVYTASNSAGFTAGRPE